MGIEGGKKRKEGGGFVAYVDQSINSSVLDHVPRVFGSMKVGFSIERNVAKGVFVDELHSPFLAYINRRQQLLSS